MPEWDEKKKKKRIDFLPGLQLNPQHATPATTATVPHPSPPAGTQLSRKTRQQAVSTRTRILVAAARLVRTPLTHVVTGVRN